MKTSNRLIRWVIAVALGLLVSGCATVKNGLQLEAGAGLQFDAKELQTYRESQDLVLAELTKLTVASNPNNAVTTWDDVIAAGMDYADGKCEAYMHALFRLNRDRRTTTAQIGLLGSATAGIMAAAKSAAKEVAIVAIAFGLASSTVDNLSSNLLYELEPSSVRTMVQTMQMKYRQELGKGYLTRPAAVTAIRRYAVLCVPASIEAEVNLSVKKAEPAATRSSPANGQPPSVTNGVTVTSDQIFGPDDNTTVLEQFLAPNGTSSDTNRRKVEAFLVSRNLRSISVASFLFGGEYAAERVRAVQSLGLKR